MCPGWMKRLIRSGPRPASDVRALGVDLGTRRIGLALCDSGEVLATPYGTIERSGDVAADHGRLAGHVVETDAEIVVVGLPRSLDGSIGPAARSVLEEVDEMAAVVGVPVQTHDERLTTVTATRDLRQAGVSGRNQRSVVDQVAASVILQSWIDSRSTVPRPPGGQ